MASLLFPNSIRLDLDDRAMAHLHRVMMAKLRRGEGFHLSWDNDSADGGGRTTIWVQPELSMTWKLVGSGDPVNPRWLDELMVAANSVAGLSPLPEPRNGVNE